ncbi:MAG TPA: response regulator transcription factor [Cyclobacteriaceae bacterium]|nr:response regulator transcription factor [Cyclobacteriaceae bacterium]HRJ83684.1 response regulator transcription factor [Cyclobacteriaceae bacterium]
MSEKKPLRVLVVDDDRDILELLKYNLWKEGYKVKVLDESSKAIKAAKSFSPDLIVLDLMMPHPNGIELCRELRKLKQFQETYIFFLTAKAEPYYQQAALDTGADDYIEKIMGLRSLTHKISAVLKKNYIIRKGAPELEVGKLTLNRKKNSVRVGEVNTMLSKPEFELLFFLAQNQGKAINHSALLQFLWGSEVYLSESSLELYMNSLEQKIGKGYIQRDENSKYIFKA